MPVPVEKTEAMTARERELAVQAKLAARIETLTRGHGRMREVETDDA